MLVGGGNVMTQNESLLCDGGRCNNLDLHGCGSERKGMYRRGQ